MEPPLSTLLITMEESLARLLMPQTGPANATIDGKAI